MAICDSQRWNKRDTRSKRINLISRRTRMTRNTRKERKEEAVGNMSGMMSKVQTAMDMKSNTNQPEIVLYDLPRVGHSACPQ